jgi:hypothetical protein
LAILATAPPSLAIGPGVRRTVDLVKFEVQAAFADLAVAVQPFSGAQKLAAGTYRVTLAVGGSDVDAEHYALTLRFAYGWDAHCETIGDYVEVTDGPRNVRPPE